MTPSSANRKMVVAVLFALFLPVLAVRAQGGDPVYQDPAAQESAMAAAKVRTPLMLAAQEVKDTEKALHRQTSAFLKKLSNNADFAQRFEDAASSGDVSQLVDLVREGGVQQGDIGVGLDAARTITITIIIGNVTIKIVIKY